MERKTVFGLELTSESPNLALEEYKDSLYTSPLEPYTISSEGVVANAAYNYFKDNFIKFVKDIIVKFLNFVNFVITTISSWINNTTTNYKRFTAKVVGITKDLRDMIDGSNAVDFTWKLNSNETKSLSTSEGFDYQASLVQITTMTNELVNNKDLLFNFNLAKKMDITDLVKDDNIVRLYQMSPIFTSYIESKNIAGNNEVIIYKELPGGGKIKSILPSKSTYSYGDKNTNNLVKAFLDSQVTLEPTNLKVTKHEEHLGRDDIDNLISRLNLTSVFFNGIISSIHEYRKLLNGIKSNYRHSYLKPFKDSNLDKENIIRNIETLKKTIVIYNAPLMIVLSKINNINKALVDSLTNSIKDHK